MYVNRLNACPRIRLDIASTNFPRYDVNPNIGEPDGRARLKRVATNTVYVDRVCASHAVLPVVPLAALEPLGPTTVDISRAGG